MHECEVGLPSHSETSCRPQTRNRTEGPAPLCTKIVLDRNVTASTANSHEAMHVKVVVVGLVVQLHTILSLTLANWECNVVFPQFQWYYYYRW